MEPNNERRFFIYFFIEIYLLVGITLSYHKMDYRNCHDQNNWVHSSQQPEGCSNKRYRKCTNSSYQAENPIPRKVEFYSSMHNVKGLMAIAFIPLERNHGRGYMLSELTYINFKRVSKDVKICETVPNAHPLHHNPLCTISFVCYSWSALCHISDT